MTKNLEDICFYFVSVMCTVAVCQSGRASSWVEPTHQPSRPPAFKPSCSHSFCFTADFLALFFGLISWFWPHLLLTCRFLTNVWDYWPIGSMILWIISCCDLLSAVWESVEHFENVCLSKSVLTCHVWLQSPPVTDAAFYVLLAASHCECLTVRVANTVIFSKTRFIQFL